MDDVLIRARAIWCALFFGLCPWWLYEDEPHYAPLSYWGHLRENLEYAWTWMTGREDAIDWTFEREVNGRGK